MKNLLLFGTTNYGPTLNSSDKLKFQELSKNFKTYVITFGDENKINHWCDSENRYFFHNAFSIFDTEFIKENPFDERLSGKEDRYWAQEQIDKGNNILYQSDLVVKHHYTNNGATWKGVG